MKKLLTVSKGEHFAARVARSMAVLLIALSLGMTLWVATMPVAEAQQMSATRMIESNLPQGQTMAKASKGDLTSAICAAIKKNRGNAAQIIRAAVGAKKQWAKDIMRAAFQCVGTGRNNCELLGEIYDALVAANPDDASEINQLALQLAPDCASAFGGSGGTDQGEGNFGNAPGNQNPPPGSISGGGGSQTGQCQVCHTTGSGKSVTLTISCNAVPQHIGHGDTEGPCPVTPTQNP
jgi:hypothetical protein